MKKLTFILMLFLSISSFSHSPKKTNTKKSIKKTQTLPKDVQVWTIDAVRAKCEGVTTQNCLLVKKPGEKDFNLFYDNIQGFNFEEGYVYTLWVKTEMKTPPIPADVSIYNYTLAKIVSKKPVSRYNNTNTNNNTKPPKTENVPTTKTLIINEERVACEGNPNAKCLLIKKQDAKTFEIFYQKIVGFNFEEGYRQTILVSERPVENPMVKQTEPIYTLIKVINKELIFTPKETTTSEAPKTILDKKWILRKMKDTDTSSYEIADNAVYMEIKSEDSRISGKAPCNNYFGGFKSDFISSFQTSAIANTRMYCNNMKMEDLYFTLLQNAERFEIKEGKLYLYKGDRLLLVFE